jgi:hypothetical protein
MPLDFFTPQRQLAAVREWQAIADAIATGSEGDVELLQRRVFFNARDAAIATLRKARNEKISKAATIRD